MRPGVVGALLCTLLSVAARGLGSSKWPMRNGGDIQRRTRPGGNCDCIHKNRFKESKHRLPLRPVRPLEAQLLDPPPRQKIRSHVLLRKQRLSTTAMAAQSQKTNDNDDIFYEPVQYVYRDVPQNYFNEELLKPLNFPRPAPEIKRDNSRIGTHMRRNNGNAFKYDDTEQNSQKMLNGINLYLDIDGKFSTSKESESVEELTKISKIYDTQNKLVDCLDLHLARSNYSPYPQFQIVGKFFEDRINICNDIENLLSENRKYIQNYYLKPSRVLKSQNEYELPDNQNDNEELDDFVILNNNILQEIRKQNKIKILQSVFTKPVLEFLQEREINILENTNFESENQNILQVQTKTENQILEDIQRQCKIVDTVLFGYRRKDTSVKTSSPKISENEMQLSQKSLKDQIKMFEVEELLNHSENSQFRAKLDILADIQKSCKELNDIILNKDIKKSNNQQLESAVTRPPLEFFPHRAGIVSYYEESTDSEISDSFSKEYETVNRGSKSHFNENAIIGFAESKGVAELLYSNMVNNTNLLKNYNNYDVTISQDTLSTPHYTNTIETSTFVGSVAYDNDGSVKNTKITTYGPIDDDTMDMFSEDENVTPTYEIQDQTTSSIPGFQALNNNNFSEIDCTTLNCTDKTLTVTNNPFVSTSETEASGSMFTTSNNINYEQVENIYPYQKATTKAPNFSEASDFVTDSTISINNREHSYASTINVADELNEYHESTTETLMRNTLFITDFTTPPTENRPNIKENNIEIPKVESYELKNGSLFSRVVGFEHIPNTDFLNVTHAPNGKVQIDSDVKKSGFLQMLSGKIIFVSNGHNIPLRFLQNTNGNIDLGIDGNYLCKHLIPYSHESVILSVLCNNNSQLIR